jgi:CMP-2-keto-3-deoxyoctulosonic acid synthetase
LRVGRDAALPQTLPEGLPALRHVGLYAYRVASCMRFPHLERPAIEQHENLEQLRALHHGCAITVLQLDAPLPPGVDTRPTWNACSAVPPSPRAHAARGRRVAHAPADDRP